MPTEKPIDNKTSDRMKLSLEEGANLSIPFWSLRDALGAREWTSDYIKDLRSADSAPEFVSLVEKFDKARNAYINAIKSRKSDKAKINKALAFKVYADCYSEAGMKDKVEEMTQKYEEEKENYILGL